MDGLGGVLALEQFVLDVDVFFDESRLVVQARAVFGSDGVGDGGFVDAGFRVGVDFWVGVAILLPQHSKIQL